MQPKLRLVGILSAIAITGLVSSCVQESTTAPQSTRTATGLLPSRNQGVSTDSDACSNDGDYPDCHNDDPSYVDPDNDMSCPTGCYTYTIDQSEMSEFNAALAVIPNDQACGWAITYMNQMILHGRVRIYFSFDGDNADTHPSKKWNSDGMPDMAAAIHFWSSRVTSSPQQLAETMVHEAYHGYFNDSSETAAHGEGVACVPSGWP